jgi:hypothetical protein
MKTPMKKYFVIALTMLTLIASAAGVTPAYAAAFGTANPASWDAGVVAVNASPVLMTVVLSNTSGATITTTYMNKIITGSTDFKFQVESSQCPFQWKAPDPCTIKIQFSPSGPGLRTANLSISFPGYDALNIPLRGTGAGPVVSIDPLSWNFGDQNVGITSAAKSFVLTNTGTSNLNIGDLAISGEFALSGNTCNGATIPAAGTCTFGVTFSPTSLGVKNGSVSIPSNASSSPNSVSLTGTGVTQVQEQIKNGGLNTYSGTSKIPVNWVKSTTFSSLDGKDTSTKKEGLASVKITGQSGKTKTLTQTLTISGVSGDTFTFTFWAKGASIPTAGICKAQVLLYNGSTLKLTKTVACKTGTYATFQKKTLTFNATSAYTKAVIKFTYSKASGTIWFDWISLTK